MYSQIPRFEERMDKMVRAMEIMMSRDDLFNRQMNIAKSHYLKHNGDPSQLWLTCLRGFSKLGPYGKEDVLFK